MGKAAKANEQDATATIGMGPAIIAGVLVIGLFFGVFGGWAAYAPLESAAIAPGFVSVDTNRKTIQHLEGGIIRDILVRDGDKVALGQVLVQLDRTRPQATLDLLRWRRMAASALEARLIAERDGTSGIAFPGWLSTTSESEKAKDIMDGEVRIFEARRESLSGQVAILKQRIAQYEEEIKGLEGQIRAEDMQVTLVNEERDIVRGLFEKGLAQKPRLLALQRRSWEIEGSRSEHKANIARAKQSIGEARLRITELKTVMLSEVVQQLRDVQSEQFDLAERMRAAEDILDRTKIRAPIAGTIVDLKVHTLEGVIVPGTPILDIVPSADRLVIETRIDPDDIDVVHPGMKAKVRFTAFSRRNSIPVDGTITFVSADHLTDELTGAKYFLAKVELADDVEVALDGASLYPGMQAEVMILTGSRTALDYILKPITRGLDRAFREN